MMNQKCNASHPVKILNNGYCRGSQLKKLPICMALSCIFSSNAHALPQSPTVVSGGVGIHSINNTLEINQTSNKAVINWQQFGIAPGESVRFNQLSSTSITLNRVTGSDSSTINGTLTANGRIFIINPNGVLFGENAQLNVGGIVATTMGINDAEFLSGNYKFHKEGNSQRSVVNSGSITAVEGGYIVMLSDQVKNNGSIDSPAGAVLMGAGAEATLYFSNQSLVGYAISKETAAALVENTKKIKAQGGTVSLVARGINSLDQAQRAVVNNAGIIEAQALKNKAGKIELSADMHSGRISVSGTLDASGMDDQGGEIATSAATVNIDPNAVINASGPAGKSGIWTVNAGDATIGEGRDSIHQNALIQALEKNNVVINALGTGVEGTGNLVVSQSISSSAVNKLSLKAIGDVSINDSVSIDKGGLVVYADTLGTGVGRVKFSGYGQISAKNNGSIDLYTNVASYTDNAIYDGFITTPYSLWMLVNTVDQLQNIGTNLSGQYALGRDIDASETRNWNGGAGFAPLGMSFSNPFAGKLDGMNRTISNLYINRPTTDYVGLFGKSEGEIRNIGLINVYVRGSDTVGAFIGDNDGGILANVYATGYVRAEGDPNIMSSGRTLFTGGLVGVNSMKLKSGIGLVRGQIIDAFSDVIVSGNSGLGGIVGFNTGSVERVFATGKIELTGDTSSSISGGIAGTNFYDGSISNAYWSNDTTGQSTVAGLNFGQVDTASINRKLTYSDLKTATLEPEFTDKWHRYDGYSIPLLKSFLKPLTVYSLDQDISKVYDGQAVLSTEKYYFSDSNINLGNLKFTPLAPYESGVDVGSYEKNIVQNVWSNQQGYLIKRPVVEKVVKVEVDYRPIIVKAVTDNRLYDGSSNSGLSPELFESNSTGNHGLASGDALTANQAFDSKDVGNRTLQVKDVNISDKNGRNVTANYKIAKLETTGVIRENPGPDNPGNNNGTGGNQGGNTNNGGNQTGNNSNGGTSGNSGGNQDSGTGNGGNQTGNNSNGGTSGNNGGTLGGQAGNVNDGGNQGSNSGNSSGQLPGGSGQANSGGNRDIPSSNNPGNNGGTIADNAVNGNNQNWDIALNTSPVDRFIRSNNSLVWQNVNDEEKQRSRQIRQIGTNGVILTVKDNGINAPAE